MEKIMRERASEVVLSNDDHPSFLEDWEKAFTAAKDKLLKRVPGAAIRVRVVVECSDSEYAAIELVAMSEETEWECQTRVTLQKEQESFMERLQFKQYQMLKAKFEAK